MHKILIFFAAILMVSTSKIHASTLQNDIYRAETIIRERVIPDEVLEKACGLALLHVVKGGFIFSGRIGSGLVIAKLANGKWSAPSAIGIGGAGFGLQAGAKVTDFILILNTQAAVDAFAGGGNVTLGGSLSIAAGPIGRTAEGSLVLPPAAIYSYSQSRGIFAGVSLEGSVIVEKEKANCQFYGKSVCPRELLSGEIPPPKCAEPLYQALQRCQQ